MQTIRGILSCGSKDDISTTTPQSGVPSVKPAVLLVIQGDNYDWPMLMKDVRLQDGRPIQVYQTMWDSMEAHVSTYSSAQLCVEISKLAASASTPPGCAAIRFPLTIQPDFVLVRNEVKTPNFDGRSRLDALIFADLPSANSLESILLFCEKPAVAGQLQRLQRKLGHEAFPVIPQHFASSHRALMYGYTFPAVVKVGSAHAGAGKMQIKDHHQMSDFRSVLQMMPSEHCTVEPFVTGSGDLRIQKIGTNYRAFLRVGISGDWKTNTCTAIMDKIEVTERYKLWADEASKMFGGLDILTVDAIVEEGTGKEYILEVNGTSSGLHPDCAEEDNGHIRELVLERMNSALC